MKGANKDRASALYTRLTVSESDLELAKRYAEYMLKNRLHIGPLQNNKAKYWRQTAFVCALVMAYGRVFTRSIGLPDFPTRLLQYDEEEKDLHRRLLDLRDTQYAHADGQHHHVTPIGTGFVSAIHTLSVMWIGKHDLDLFLPMIDSLLGRIRRRLSELHTEITGRD